ncbi:hypothetical protein [Streptomyces sp. CBMA29]|uniref:hypothetical protein n=1 Tax=Streptomyces sp. CBMA29 TaxID=1896314 RepID=UPI001661A5DE|nr:hypothetical protein [Streptomyces sp. CBMA29]
MTAGVAHAAESDFATRCVPPAASGLGPIDGTTKADITAPATAKVGDTVTVTWKTVQAASKNPDIIDLPADKVQPSGKVTLGGAQTGTLDVQGPRQNPAIPKNSEMKLSDMTGTLKLTKAGDITLSPGAYTINVSYPISTDTVCTPTADVPVATTIKVTDGGGTTSGGTTTGGTTTGGTTTGGTTTGGTTTGGTTTGGTTTGGTSGGSTSGGTGGTSFKGTSVNVPYACKTLIGDKSATSKVEIDAAKASSGYDLTVKFGNSVMDSPTPISKGMITPSIEVLLSGAQTGSLTLTGSPNSTAFAQNAPITIDDIKGRFVPGKTGKIGLSPGVLTIKLTDGGTAVATCTPTKAAPVSLTLDTTAAPGGGTTGSTTTGGSTTAGSSTTGSTTGGDLAATGSDANGPLRALGYVAATALLLGAAVFTFTPWRRFLRR